MDILSVNIGSSSLKFALYPVAGHGMTAPARVTGLVERLESGTAPVVRLRSEQGVHEAQWPLQPGESPLQAALRALRPMLSQHLGATPLAAVAHRIVHGGPHFKAPVILDEPVLVELDALSPLAPLHQPFNLAGVRACMQVFEGVPQIGCFDTAFHQTLGPQESMFALPAALRAQGIRRYGFHGLSYQYVAQILHTLSDRGQGRVLMAHLGNGASLCAMQQGCSVATTMGFSALDGLMMGTRSGAIDPGVLLYLMQQGWDEARISRLLYRESGLLGVSGESADMRTLRASKSDAARQAIDLFVYRIQREGGGLMTVMQGVDAVVFTGGIGEHDAATRQAVVQGWQVWGLRLSLTANEAADGRQPMRIDAPDSAVQIWVIPTDEGRVAAQEAATLLKLNS